MSTETTAPATIDLLGGEMLAWSDRPREEPAPGGQALAALTARVVPPGARVLLAGYHDPAVVAALVTRDATVTSLVRSFPDGEQLAARAIGPQGRVLVGGVHGIPAGESFDAVIALGGLTAIRSLEGEQPGWDDVLARLAAAVRPGGTLLLRVDNPVGLHQLVAATPWYADRDDAAWVIDDGPLHAGHPANPQRLSAALGAAGLATTACFAAYPHPARPTVLVDTAVLDDVAATMTVPGIGLLDAALGDACAAGFAGTTVLRDPARLAVDALHSGIGTGLAGGWVAVAGRASSDAPLPVAVLETGPPTMAETSVATVTASADGWHRHVETNPVDAVADRVVRRDANRIAGPVPAGRLLRTLLVDACVRRDLARLRELLRGYADWLDTHSADDRTLSGTYALATCDNVVVAGTTYDVLDPSWQAATPQPTDVVLARGLRRFAAELLTGGYAHPWPSTVDVAGLSVVLAGVAGRDLDAAVVVAGVELEADVVAAMRGLDAAGREALAAELRSVTATAPPAGLDSYQDLREAWLRQREDRARIEALLRWTEQLLTSREHALKRAQMTVNLLNGSISYRLGRLLITPARLAKRYLRRAVRRVRRMRNVRQEMQ